MHGWPTLRLDLPVPLYGTARSPRPATGPRRPGGGGAYTGGMPTQEDVIEALREVEDPELGMDIVEIGLLYDVDVSGPNVKVSYSLTSMGCPAGPMIQEGIYEAVTRVPGVENVETELTWDPPWTPDKMSEDAKFILGFGLQFPADGKLLASAGRARSGLRSVVSARERAYG